MIRPEETPRPKTPSPRSRRASPRAALALAALAALAAAACSPTSPPAEPAAAVVPAHAGSPDPGAAESPDEERSRIAAVLDDWHDAAAKADEKRYFAHLTEQAVFIGTDATERWDKAAFRAYASPHFAKGKAWRFRSIRRAILLSPSADTAWFDEDLATEKLGPARGSGVLVRAGKAWQIAHYVLSIPVPNERFEAVRKVIAAEPPDPGGGW